MNSLNADDFSYEFDQLALRIQPGAGADAGRMVADTFRWGELEGFGNACVVEHIRITATSIAEVCGNLPKDHFFYAPEYDALGFNHEWQCALHWLEHQADLNNPKLAKALELFQLAEQLEILLDD